MGIRLTTEYVKNFLHEKGYELLTPKYVNALQTLKVRCKNGHFREIKFSVAGYTNQECGKCVSEKSRHTIQFVKNIFNISNYTLLSTEYTGAAKKLKVLCPRNHEWLVSLNKFYNVGQRCPKCSFSGGTSRLENEVFEEVFKLYPSAKKTKHRNINIENKPYIKGFDIDIYIPELRAGVEFDGTYYHSLDGLRRSYPDWPIQEIKNYHKIKDLYFKSKNIDILHIKEQNWIKDREKCLFLIFSFLKNRQNKTKEQNV